MFFSNECKRVRDLLWDLAAGSLSDSDKKIAESHVSECAACRTELDAYRSTTELLVGFKDQEMPVSRLGWRDLEYRVTAQQASRLGVYRQPWFKMLAAGGSLAAATAMVMFVMQSATLNTDDNVEKPLSGRSVVVQPKHDQVGFGADPLAITPFSSGMIDNKIILPAESDPVLRSTPPRAHSNLRIAGVVSHPGKRPSAPIQIADENVDGSGQRQTLRPDYVMTPASSGNDEDQNRRYVIDVVSSSTASSAGDTEESHPW